MLPIWRSVNTFFREGCYIMWWSLSGEGLMETALACLAVWLPVCEAVNLKDVWFHSVWLQQNQSVRQVDPPPPHTHTSSCRTLLRQISVDPTWIIVVIMTPALWCSPDLSCWWSHWFFSLTLSFVPAMDMKNVVQIIFPAVWSLYIQHFLLAWVCWCFCVA